jgi:hypothetical protein
MLKVYVNIYSKLILVYFFSDYIVAYGGLLQYEWFSTPIQRKID